MSLARTRAALLALVGLMVAVLVVSCSKAATHKAHELARGKLNQIDADSLGRVLGNGSYGSAGPSGGPPTDFVAVEVAQAPTGVISAVRSRVERLGFVPYGRCTPELGCNWQRRVNGRLVTATAIVFGAGQPWGNKSTSHGTVALGAHVLELLVTVGG